MGQWLLCSFVAFISKPLYFTSFVAVNERKNAVILTTGIIGLKISLLGYNLIFLRGNIRLWDRNFFRANPRTFWYFQLNSRMFWCLRHASASTLIFSSILDPAIILRMCFNNSSPSSCSGLTTADRLTVPLVGRTPFL